MLYNATLNASIQIADLTGSDRITKRIARKVGDFDHGSVAAYFLAHQHDVIPTLSTDTLKRFEACIDALVKALPPP